MDKITDCRESVGKPIVQACVALRVKSEGRFLAEYQVLLAHPVQADRYVESVQVWGRPETLRGDATIVEYL